MSITERTLISPMSFIDLSNTCLDPITRRTINKQTGNSIRDQDVVNTDTDLSSEILKFLIFYQQQIWTCHESVIDINVMS